MPPPALLSALAERVIDGGDAGADSALGGIPGCMNARNGWCAPPVERLPKSAAPGACR